MTGALATPLLCVQTKYPSLTVAGVGQVKKKPAQQKLKQETCLALAVFLTRPQADLQIGANWKITLATASVKTNLAEALPALVI